MATNDPPADVGSLVAKVKTSLANIDKHRKAMAAVSAQIKATQPVEPNNGVTQQ